MTQPQDPRIGRGVPSGVTVGTASVSVVKANETRRRIVITNISDTRIDLVKGEVAILNQGIALNANGGVLVDEPDTDGFMYVGPWSAISSAATKLLAVHEE